MGDRITMSKTTLDYAENVMKYLNELSALMTEHLSIRTVRLTQNVGGLPFTRPYRRREKIIETVIAWIADGWKYPELRQIVPKLKKINSAIGSRHPLTLEKATELSETYDLSLNQIAAFYNLSPNKDDASVDFGQVQKPVPGDFEKPAHVNAKSLSETKNIEDEQDRRTVTARLLYLLRQIIQQKFLLTAEEKKKILENAVEKNYSANSLNIIRISEDEALKLGSDHIGTEHILLALVHADSSGASRLLNNLQKGIAKKVEDTIKQSKGLISKAPLPLTKRAELVLKIANHEAKVRNSNTTRSQHLLLALINEKDGVGGSLLLKLGISYEMICNQFDNQRITCQKEENIMMYEKEIRACASGEEITDMLSSIWDEQNNDIDKHTHGTEFIKTLKQLIESGVIELRGGSVTYMPWRGINVPIFSQGNIIKINNH